MDALDPPVAERTVVVDGPALRAARDSQQVPMRRIARAAGMSHGHLSKVERGEHGRPVTPRILFAYEKCLGVKLADAIAAGQLLPEHRQREGRDWQPGQMNDFQRRSWRAQVAAVAAGGSVGMPTDRLLHTAGRVTVPRPVTDEQVTTLQRVAGALEDAGALAGAVAHALLSWAIRLPTSVDGDRQLHAVLARLARRAATEACASSRHESARTLWLLGLAAAASADDPDLRGLILADIATQHTTLGYYDDARSTLRFADGDERLSDNTRATLTAARALTDARTSPPPPEATGEPPLITELRPGCDPYEVP